MRNKKLILITIAALFTVNVWGQWIGPDANQNIYYTGGNVGIGTNNPKDKLEIYGGGNLLIKGGNNDAGDLIFQTNSELQLGRVWSNNGGISGLYLSSGDNIPDITIHQNGTIGIGTTNPIATLQIGDSDNSESPSSEIEAKRLSLAPVTHSGPDWFFTTRDNNPYANLDIGYANDKALTLRHDGNIGIGTTNPTYKLAVKGTIGCGEIKVENTAGWPDFVFGPNYNLRTLKRTRNLHTTKQPFARNTHNSRG